MSEHGVSVTVESLLSPCAVTPFESDYVRGQPAPVEHLNAWLSLEIAAAVKLSAASEVKEDVEQNLTPNVRHRSTAFTAHVNRALANTVP